MLGNISRNLIPLTENIQKTVHGIYKKPSLFTKHINTFRTVKCINQKYKPVIVNEQQVNHKLIDNAKVLSRDFNSVAYSHPKVFEARSQQSQSPELLVRTILNNQPDELVLNREVIDFTSIEIQDINCEIKTLVNKCKSLIITGLKVDTNQVWSSLIEPLIENEEKLSSIIKIFSHLDTVRNDKNCQKDYIFGLLLLREYRSWPHNSILFQFLKNFQDSPEFEKLSALQKTALNNKIHNLAKDENIEYKQLYSKVAQLQDEFYTNIVKSTANWNIHITDIEALDGLPVSTMKLAELSAKNIGLTSGWLLTLPLAPTILTYCKNELLRKTVYDAYVSKASSVGPQAGQFDNSLVISDIVRVQKEISQLLGFNSFAEKVTAENMAETPEKVMLFLNNIITASKPQAQNEFLKLVEFAKEKYDLDTVAQWNYLFIAEKHKESLFQFSSEEIKAYFPLNSTLQGTWKLMEKVFGLTIKELDTSYGWHSDVKTFSVTDNEGKKRGHFYIDLFSREGKRNVQDDAWMFALQNNSASSNLTQLPICALVCNFEPAADNTEPLLTHENLITLLHELGHTLHQILSKVQYPNISGISELEKDYVEVPSKLMENFAWDPTALQLLSSHKDTKETMPNELLEKLIASKNHLSALNMLERAGLMLFDIRLYHNNSFSSAAEIKELRDSIYNQTSMLEIPSINHTHHSNTHIFDGSYSGCLYSYLWSEVIAADAFYTIQQDGFLNTNKANSFISNILETGASKKAMANYKNFKDSNLCELAFLKNNGIKIEK